MIKHKKIFIKKSNDDSIYCKIIIKQSNQFSIEFVSKELGEYEWRGIDILDCFNQMRIFLESKGFVLLVNGTVKNTWASGGLRDSSNGELTYFLDEKSEPNILNIFEFCDINNVTYEKHIEYYKNWLKQHR
jgi:hypothetical protein